MVALFIDGFDKYGPANQTTPAPSSMLLAGEWTTFGGLISIVAGLSGSGQAVNLSSTNGGIAKTLAGNSARVIGGVRVSPVGTPVANLAIMQYKDTTNPQFTILLNASGTISMMSGAANGTVIATSTASMAVGSIHYIEWDVTIGASASYQIWMDGASILSGTGNTRAGSSNNYANNIYMGTSFSTSPNITFDDLYLFDSTGATCNAVLLNNPIVETAFPSSDAQKQWTAGAAILGTDNSVASATNPNANQIYLRPYTAPQNMTLNSISFVPSVSNGTANFRPVVYAGMTTGAALVTAGPTVVGCLANATVTMPLTTPQSLVGGTTYYIGIMLDSVVTMNRSDLLNACSSYAATFTSGAPSTLPAPTTGQLSIQMWGNCSAPATNYAGINANPPIDDISYNWSATVNQEDLYGFPPLASNPASVALVAYKARAKRSDSGARTVEVHCASGAADSAGSTAGGVAPASSFQWIGNYLPLDPNTGVAWTGPGINAATAGPKVSS